MCCLHKACIPICLLVIMNILLTNNCYSLTSLDKDALLKSFPLTGGTFSDVLDHRTEWVLHDKNTIRSISWLKTKKEERVFLDDTKFYNYDKDRDDGFYYRGQLIDPKKNLDLSTRSFTYYKTYTYLYLYDIYITRYNYKKSLILKIENTEYININNIKLYKSNNGNEYLFIYLKSGEKDIKSGFYCYKLNDILKNNNKTFDNIPNILVPTNLGHYYENWSISENLTGGDSLILTTAGKHNKEYNISNYFINFKLFFYIKNILYKSKHTLFTPKILQNTNYRLLTFKEVTSNKKLSFIFCLLNNNYNYIRSKITYGSYPVNIPINAGMSFIERDIGIQSVWKSNTELLAVASSVVSEGNAIQGLGTELIILEIDLKDRTVKKITKISKKEYCLYFNFDIYYNKDTTSVDVFWLAEMDINKNGFLDNDIFLSRIHILTGDCQTINISKTPRRVWSPQLITTEDNITNVVWLQEHPLEGYQFYFQNSLFSITYYLLNNVHLPLYGDSKETYLSFIFYLLLTVLTGIIKGISDNLILLLFLSLFIVFIYRLLGNISTKKHTIILLLLQIIVLIVNFNNIITSIIIIIISLILDRKIIKNKRHNAIETCVKLWLFTIILSVLTSYNSIYVFIKSNMIITF